MTLFVTFWTVCIGHSWYSYFAAAIYPGLYRQEYVIPHILHEKYSAHNAEDDVSSLGSEADLNLKTLHVLHETKVLSKIYVKM